ncbi:MAG TPA: L-histidine N(alpha)-methyltransferase [Planctomycetota bacterium]|nr:L-histidine N(alpha)-methyltransferase [Planctomycetota bacterium]
MTPQSKPNATLHEIEPHLSFREEVLRGLRKHQKQIPCKYLYDDEGSRLFDQICELEEYYITRTEIGILDRDNPEIARLMGRRCLVVEYGSGSTAKIRILLRCIQEPAAYVPVDISRFYLLRAVDELGADFPSLRVLPVCADFTAAFDLPECPVPSERAVVFFPGSTIGNFTPGEARILLGQIAAICGQHGGLLVGVDLKKDPAVLEAAYNDRCGVTARFNLNVLARINRELHADFRLDRFRHLAFYNAEHGRIEMHLVSLADQAVTVAGEQIELRARETIHTENSHKYTLDDFHELAAKAGFSVRHVWTDDRRLFSVQYLTPKPQLFAEAVLRREAVPREI